MSCLIFLALKFDLSSFEDFWKKIKERGYSYMLLVSNYAQIPLIPEAYGSAFIGPK